MDYYSIVGLKEKLRDKLAELRANGDDRLPEEMIIRGNANDGYRLSVITKKGSGINTVDDLPRELGIPDALKEAFDVKESRASSRTAEATYPAR